MNKICVDCGKMFTALRSDVKRCPECYRARRKEYNTEYIKKRRAKKYAESGTGTTTCVLCGATCYVANNPDRLCTTCKIKRNSDIKRRKRRADIVATRFTMDGEVVRIKTYGGIEIVADAWRADELKKWTWVINGDKPYATIIPRTRTELIEYLFDVPAGRRYIRHINGNKYDYRASNLLVSMGNAQHFAPVKERIFTYE